MSKKYFFPMQRWVTIKGSTVYTGDIVQPQADCADGEQADQMSFTIKILGNTVATGTTICSLLMQEALAVEGPWNTVNTLTAASTVVRQYYTSDEEGTNNFQRFMRWKLDPSGCIDDWSICFKIDGVMK